MKKLLMLMAAFGVMFYLSSCGDDDDDPNLAEPQVTAPTATAVQVETTQEFTFTFTAEAGYASVTVTEQGGTATETEPAAGATSGDIVVSFTAGSTVTTGSITVEVTDAEGDTDEATVSFSITASAVPTIEGIPTAASIVDGQTLTVPGPITLTSEDGFAATNAFTLSVNGGPAVDLGVAGTATSPVELTNVALPTSDLEPGTYEILFTLTDTDNESATFLHILTVEPITFFSQIDTDDNGTPDNAADDLFFLEISGSINADFELPVVGDDGEEIAYYVLAGRVKVTNGATFTIPAGSLLKARTGGGASASTLLVTRGSTLMAEGTATQPIIFTAISDRMTMQDIDDGNFVGSLDPGSNGLWGGLIILGSAPISAGEAEVGIEGIPGTDTDGIYGGTDAADNSGVITYVSIRHGGSNIGQGNEINGLSLGGVGSGTTIENIEIVANADDGIEWFGGNVDIDGALIWNSGDDSMDTDQDWQGTCSNFLIVTPFGSAFELDGPEGPAARGGGFHSFDVGTIYAGPEIGFLVDWDAGDRATNAQLTNLYFYAIEAGYTGGIESFQGDQSGTSANWEATIPGGSTLAEIFNDGASAIVAEVAANANTVGVQNDDNFKWTWPGSNGTLDGLGL